MGFYQEDIEEQPLLHSDGFHLMMGKATIYQGNALDILKALPTASHHCVVTSPPYYGLRDYGTGTWVGGNAECDHRLGNQIIGERALWPGASTTGVRPGGDNSHCRKCGAKRVDKQVGLEGSPDEYVATLVELFREVRRVLHDSGVVWLNLGDCYAGQTGYSGAYPSTIQRNELAKMGITRAGKFKFARDMLNDQAHPRRVIPGKPKDLVGIPWMVAFALRDDGWYLRSEVIWTKANPMPESAKDRPTNAHEQIFLLTKKPHYFYDNAAVAERHAWEHVGAMRQGPTSKNGGSIENPVEGKGNTTGSFRGFAEEGRNLRDVWPLNAEPYPEAHFACVDEQTECLTSTGWKNYADLRIGMLAAQFDVGTSTLSWAPVEAIARYNVTDQPMIVGSSRDISMRLTPNHRSIIQRRHPRTRKLQPPAVVRADRLKASHSIPTAADWAFDGDASLPLEWAELLGWYVAEGHESKNSLAVELYQSESANSANCRRIEELLRQVGAEWTKATHKRQWRGEPNENSAYRITGYAALRLRELAPRKKLPWSTVLWDESRIGALLVGLIAGDGHERINEDRWLFVQKDLEQCGLIQALAMRLGLSANVTSRRSEIWNTGVVYMTKHRTRSFRGTNGRGAPPTIEPYSGVVWCPKLPHGTWVARRNGKAFVTGNTFPIDLPTRCIKAGTSEQGCCERCGAPYKRDMVILGKKQSGHALGKGHTPIPDRPDLDVARVHKNVPKQVGWQPSCSCRNADRVPCRVLDPFGGAMTTAVAACRL